MATERLGYQRLYDAAGCSLQEQPECHLEFIDGGKFNVGVYIGPRPRFGIWVNKADKQLVAGEASTIHMEFQKDASQSTYPRKFFTEVYAWEEVQVEQALSEAFHAKRQDAVNSVLARAAKEAEGSRPITELLAGTIGLRFHRQLATYLICESYFAFFEDGDFASSPVSPALEVLERACLTKQGVEGLRGLQGLADVARRKSPTLGPVALSWLMRAWAEQEPISKFLALFIPLEMILQGYEGGAQPETERRTGLIRQLIATNAGEGKDELLRYFEHLVNLQRPGLPARFRQLAQRAGTPGWDRDADAFHRFNQLRNALLHRGDPGIRLVVSVSEEEVRQLQDIVERYVSQSLFGDGAVYQSTKRWTKPPRLPGVHEHRPVPPH